MININAYKGFDSDLSCRNLKYEVGKTYRYDGPVKACRSGFHACANPFNVWNYYFVVDENGALSRYAEVELSGDMDIRNDKVAAKQITIKAEIDMPDFVNRIIALAGNSTKKDDLYTYISSSYRYDRILAKDHHVKIASSGYQATILSSGDQSQIASIGSFANIMVKGNHSRIASTGCHSHIVCKGDYPRIVATGENSTIVCTGIGAIVTAGPRSAISIACFDYANSRIRFATGYVGEDGIEAGKPYRADSSTGKLVEFVVEK